MTPITIDTIVAIFLVFCRIGACFMVLPGISSERVPPQARLFLAVAIALAMYSSVASDVSSAAGSEFPKLATYVATETLTGLLLGFFIRIFFVALEFGATAAANFAGYGSVFSQAIDGGGTASPLASLLTLTATTLFFVLDQHVRMLQLLQASYSLFPPVRPFDWEPTLASVVGVLGSTFRLALQVSAPLVVLSLGVNFLAGVLNKMVPQVPVYFVSTPFILIASLLTLYFLVGEMLLVFENGVTSYISEFLRRG